MSFTAGNASSKEFPATLESLYPMLSFIEEGAATLKKEVLLRIRLACEEAIVNIIKHANPPRGIEVTVKRGDKCFHVELIDQGLFFDPLEFVSLPRLPGSEGSGIRLMIRTAERVRYLREGKNNRLILEFAVE